jgi:hypothetical protein
LREEEEEEEKAPNSATRDAKFCTRALLRLRKAGRRRGGSVVGVVLGRSDFNPNYNARADTFLEAAAAAAVFSATAAPRLRTT